MNQLAKEISAEVVELIHHYGFDLGGYSSHALVNYWMEQYPAIWIRHATIEALYQGRYKAISIEQILNLWRRRTRPVYHFNGEFERMVTLRPMLSASSAAAASEAKSDRPSAQPDSETQGGSSESWVAGGDASSEANPARSKVLGETAGEIRPLSSQSSWEATQSRFFSGRTSSGDTQRTPTGEPPSIDQFTPTLEVTDFYWRLKAVVQAMGAGSAEEIGRRN